MTRIFLLVVKDIDASRTQGPRAKSERRRPLLKKELQDSATRLNIARFFSFEPGGRADAVFEIAITKQSTAI